MMSGTHQGLFAFVPGWVPDWAVALAVFALILAFGYLLKTIAIRVVAAHSKTWHPFSQRIFQRTHQVGQYAFFLLAVVLALPLVPLSDAVEGRVHRVLVAAVIVLLGWVVTVAGNLMIDRYEGNLRIDAVDNLLARKAVTQLKVIRRTLNFMLVLMTVALALMTFNSVRQFGVSLFASAGLAGIVVGIAARPLFENLIAGVQLAITQPIRVEDAVVINNEWGWVEEITSTYVVIRLWDWRRQIVPLSYLLQNPFANWTRTSSSIIGTVLIYLDYALPVEKVRAKAAEIAAASKLWDGKVVNVQVSDARERTMEVRILVSASDSSKAWDLRCEMREKLIAYVRDTFPGALPCLRLEERAVSVHEPVAIRLPEQA